MVNIAVPSWFNLEILGVMAGEIILEEKSQEVLRHILRLGLAQPFQGLGYNYHKNVRQVLLNQLKEEPNRAIKIYLQHINYLGEQLGQLDALTKNVFQRELGHKFLELGEIYHQKEGPQAAIECWQKSLAYFREAEVQFEEQKIGAQKYIATVSHKLGQAYLAQKDFEQAEANYDQAIAIFIKLGDIPRGRDLLLELGSALADNHEWERADRVYKKLLSPEISYDPYELSEEVSNLPTDYNDIIARYYYSKGFWHEEQENWNWARESYEQAKKYFNLKGDLQLVHEMERKIRLMEMKDIITATKQTIAKRIPQLAGAAATGLVPLSLGLALANIIQSTPEEVFIYLAGLAPDFMSDMLLAMRLGEKPVDVEAIAAAVADKLDDPGVRRLADELEVLNALALMMQNLQAQSEQLQQLNQRFVQEMQALKKQNWPIPQIAETTINMIAQGQNIAQATGRSNAVVAINSTVNINQPTKRFVRILVSSSGEDLLEQREKIVAAVGKITLTDFELEVKASQAVSLREADRNIAECDVYIGLLGKSQDDKELITTFEIDKARELHRTVLLYYKELAGTEIDEKQQGLINGIKESGHGYTHEFGVFDSSDEWAERAKNEIETLLSGNFKARKLPTSGKRGLIASLGRSPGAVTGLYYALEEKDIQIDYVRTISTSDPEVSRAVTTVRDELRSKVDYEDIAITAKEFRSERDVIEFKRAFVELLVKARSQGDTLAIGVTGGRTVMGALLAQVAQMEAPANSAFYQLSVPDAIEEDGRYPRFGNQRDEYKRALLNPKKFMPRVCDLIEISFNHFYDDVYEGI